MKKIAVMVVAGLVTAMMLTGCKPATAKRTKTNHPNIDIVKLDVDNRTVTCVTFNDDGISCDWANAR